MTIIYNSDCGPLDDVIIVICVKLSSCVLTVCRFIATALIAIVIYLFYYFLYQ